MAVFNCLIIREIDLGIFAETGSFTRKEQILTTHLWSRQLEHSDYNLEKMERFMREHRVLIPDSSQSAFTFRSASER